jgi:hypothetical protein
VSIDAKGMKVYNPNDNWRYTIPMTMIKKKKIGGYMTPIEESVNESDLGLTLKKGKTITVTHKKSGKELVIIDKPSVKKEYEKIGFFAEGKVNEDFWAKPAVWSNQEARLHLDKDIRDMSKILGKASQQVIKVMMSGVKGDRYDALDIQKGRKTISRDRNFQTYENGDKKTR